MLDLKNLRIVIGGRLDAMKKSESAREMTRALCANCNTIAWSKQENVKAERCAH